MKFETYRENYRCPEIESVLLSSSEQPYQIASMVASGELATPFRSTGKGDYEFTECPNAVNKKQYRQLTSELFLTRQDGLTCPFPAKHQVIYCYSQGFYRAILKISRMVRDRKAPFRAITLPSKSKPEFQELKTRVYQACCEGLLYGLATWDASRCVREKGQALPALLSHCIFWVERYAAHEATQIRGEALGLQAQAEASMKEVIGHKYWRLRKIARAYEEAKSIYCCEPSLLDIVATAKEIGLSDISTSSVQAFLEQHYSYDVDDLDALDSPLPKSAKIDLLAVSRASRGELPTVSGPLAVHRPEDLEGYEILAKMRDQLFTAIAGDEVLCLDAEIAKVVDAVYFTALPLEDTEYSYVAPPSPSGVCVEDMRRRIASSEISNRWRARLNERVSEIAQGDADGVLVIPEIDARHVVYGARMPLQLMVDEEGMEDSLTRIRARTRRYDNRVALRLCIIDAIDGGADLERPVDFVTPEGFKEKLSLVRFVTRTIRKHGYLDPSSKNVIPVIKELGLIDSGCVLAAQRLPSGEQLYVSCDEGLLPMVSWEKPKPRCGVCGYEPPKRSSGLQAGEEIEWLRRAYVLGVEECDLERYGSLQRRCVLVRSTNSQAPVAVTREGVTRYYDRVEKLLPRSLVQIGDLRVPGEKYCSPKAEAIGECIEMSRAFDVYRDKYKPSLRVYKPPTVARLEAGGIPFSEDAFMISTLRKNRDDVALVRYAFSPGSDLMCGLRLEPYQMRIVKALRLKGPREMRSADLRQ